MAELTPPMPEETEDDRLADSVSISLDEMLDKLKEEFPNVSPAKIKLMISELL